MIWRVSSPRGASLDWSVDWQIAGTGLGFRGYHTRLRLVCGHLSPTEGSRWIQDPKSVH